ncbi:unnamed protein product [Colias eurytheme]|nr:unnamed protein product [Colias eurytheme]
MTSVKKNIKSKFVPDDLSDFLNESQFLKDSPKKKKPQKRQKIDQGDENVPNILEFNDQNPKKKKIHQETEVCGESRQKILNIMNCQLESRKKINENLQKNLNEVINHLENDYNVLKENEQKLEHLTTSYMKCMQQATAAHKQKLRAFKEIQMTYKKECDDLEAEHKSELAQLAEELEEDINKLKQKLISETKRNGWETLRRSFFQAMQNDF